MARGPHPQNRLTAATARKLGPGLHADGNGLYLRVDDTGSRRWAWRGVVHGRRREIGIGPFSLYSLAEAREMARRFRRVAREGGDPVAERDRDRRQSLTFEEAARRVHAEQVAGNSRNAKHASQWLNSLERLAFPLIGAIPVHALSQADVLRVLSPIWTETPETARRVRQRINVVMDWSIAAGHREAMNPVHGVERGLPKQREKARHHAALPYGELPELMARLAASGGMGALALRFAILTAARSGEVRGATWAEFDLDAAVWVIPAGRMKAGEEHRVPLSPEAVAVLREAQARAVRREALVFQGAKPGRSLSDMTLGKALKTAGCPPERGTVHGMRSTFRDWAEEVTSFPHEVKEAALAHKVRNAVEAAYRRTDLFEKRRKLMVAWAGFAAGQPANVVGLKE